MGRYTLTWPIFQATKINTIDTFEDPVYSAHVEKDIFIEMYGKVLEALDGEETSFFVDFYFEPSPVFTTAYIFRNEDAKIDFRDFAMELGLLPELVEIMEGESRKEKQRRQHSTRRKEEGRPDPERRKQHRTKQAQVTLDRLMQKLKSETDPAMRVNIQRKIQSTLGHLDTSV